MESTDNHVENADNHIENTDNLDADNELPLDILMKSESAEEETFEELENFQVDFEEDLNSDIQDETANYVFTNTDSLRKKSKPQKGLKPIETKLENETSQRGYYKVCKEIEGKIPSYYNDNVVKSFTFLLDNQKIVNKEYGTQEDQPDGEWIIDAENADEETLEKEINRLKIKLQNVHNENKKLEKKKKNVQTRLSNAIEENERLQSELDQ